ncbi:MAG TPA: S41 family peptidase [Bdellovibrionales bacterium]|nr:S41 family peptidase [Bdellovibrionales bacterium]
MKKLLLAIAVSVGIQAFAAQFTTEQKLADFHVLNAMIEASYAPYLYKTEALKIDTGALKADYEQRIATTTSNEEFYYKLVQYVAEFRDGHFGVRIPTNYVSYLPIRTELVEGKILIESVDRKLLPSEKFPFEKGDEVVSLDGRAAADVLAEIHTYINSGFEKTRDRIAAWSIFTRSARRLPAPEGKLRVEIRRGTSSLVEAVELDWMHSGTKTVETVGPVSSPMALGAVQPFGINELSAFDVYEDFLNGPAESGFMCSGGTRTAIPADATVIRKEPFVAYYYATAKGNVGYLRIPHYMPESQEAYRERFAQYEAAVDTLEKNTVGLIIDQDHNCGGRVDFLEDFLGLFMTQAYQPTSFQLRADKATIVSLESEIEQSKGMTGTIDYEQLVKDTEIVRKAWQAGDFLSPKIFFTRAPHYPNPIHYTKPIIVLIDELSGSGGDAFPALIQGYGRAKLLGTRTSGLGGHINSMPALPFSRLSLSMTRSLFFRPDGVPVENNGAEPDIPYSITRDDFLYEYRAYQRFYTDQLLALIP